MHASQAVSQRNGDGWPCMHVLMEHCQVPCGESFGDPLPVGHHAYMTPWLNVEMLLRPNPNDIGHSPSLKLR